MKERKVRFKFFTISECKEEQEYLQEQHRNGWKFRKAVFPFLYLFDRCQPEDVVYQLDYNKEGLKEQDTYKKMFEDAGWEYVTEFVGFTYFRKPVSEMNGQEEIFSDDTSKADMYQRIWMGRMPILLAIMGLVIIPQLIMQISKDASIHNSMLLAYVLALVVYIGIIGKFSYDYRKMRNQCR